MTANMPYKVVIDGRRTGQLWGYYPTADEAAKSAQRLRVLGMHARVVAADDDPGGGSDLTEGSDLPAGAR